MDIHLTSAVVEVFASDLAASLEFYRLLGLAVPDGDEHVVVALPGGSTLALDTEQTIKGMHPDWTPPAAPGRVALALGLASPSEVDAVFDRVTAAGHHATLPPYDAPWGQRYATVSDPDGNWVDLFAPLAT
jgi:uncharacterized glyoxalase superfamily protein PhnB